ncbi:hypothetical protein [Desertivirga arenae]|uniref:hypothetical protein n=1 Tax=Desertivirga arenae TaxID=2810309 RepID=UPI001A97D2E2|nr:hypothetical protein [Pedobacter sp. SYSU D00823]
MDYSLIIKKAWKEFNPFKIIHKIEDISAMVSTNHVFRVTFEDEDIVIAKLSYFGKYDHFKEDHRIIHTLANNLLYPFDNVLAKSLLKNNRVFTYRYNKAKTDAWVVFYNPVRVQERLPRRLDESQIRKLGEQMGRFHKACSSAKSVLPKSSKTLRTDINVLLKQLSRKTQRQFDEPQKEILRSHCEKFLVNRLKCKADAFESIPVFIDWNIGNFSVTSNQKLFSRWDYDWFRMSTRMMDFYFLSRVVSDVGDRTVFSYVVTTLMEERFLIFLEEYHNVNPLTSNEVRFLKEVYRFFILNYVIKDGKYFFSEQYAEKLQKEAFDIYLPSVDTAFDARKILDRLKLK